MNAVLDLPTLAGGMLRPQITAFALAPLLERLRQDFGPLAARSGRELTIRSTCASVRSDPALLERMLRTLVGAVLRTSGSGRVLIGCRPRGSRLRIEIWSSAPGAGQDLLDAPLTEPLRTRTERAERRLSLRQAARFLGVELLQHGSSRGGGALLALLLDQDGVVPDKAQAIGAGQGAEARQTVLVIEDEPAQRMSLSLLLEDWGYTVKAAGDLPSALREVEGLGEPPSFVVSDFRLPGGQNGVEAIREIGRRAGKAVPGIILTGDTDPERLREAQQSGCILMHKPVSLGSLKHAVASLAGRSAD